MQYLEFLRLVISVLILVQNRTVVNQNHLWPRHNESDL
jgi:hypothetical protein